MERQESRLKQFVDEASEMRLILRELKNQLQNLRTAEKATSERNHYNTDVSSIQYKFGRVDDSQFNEHIEANRMTEAYEQFEEDDFVENSCDADEEMANMSNQWDHASNMAYVEVKREPNLEIAECSWYNDVIDNNEPMGGHYTKISLNKSARQSTNVQPLKVHQKTAQFPPYVKKEPQLAHDIRQITPFSTECSTDYHSSSPAISKTARNHISTIEYDDSDESIPVELD